MAHTICVIQARRQSTRLPDKILLPLSGKPVLQHVVERCQRIEGVSEVVVAAPDNEHESSLGELVETCGARFHQGPLNDVLSRYWGAVQNSDCSLIMRVTADCPLIDPDLCGALIAKTLEKNADYGGLGGWPHGLDCEVFTRALLGKTHREAKSPQDREHVTLWMKRQPDIKRIGLRPDGKSLHEGNRWVVDYPEDYQFLCELFKLLPQGNLMCGWKTILATVNNNPHIRDINAEQEEKWASNTRKIYDAAKGLAGNP